MWPLVKGASSLLLWLFAVAAVSLPAWANPQLEKLRCLGFVTLEDLSELKGAVDLTSENLNLIEEMVVVVKARLPRLGPEVGLLCPNSLEVTVELRDDRRGGYYGAVLLYVARSAIVSDTGKKALVVVWRERRVVSGPLLAARNAVLRAIDDLITRLAVDYYLAGNP